LQPIKKYQITGAAVIIFYNIPTSIFLSVPLGCGMMMFSALGCFSTRKDSEE
jgi:lipopolysaccharide export LptBFGC system permease protein LptF